MFKVYFDGLCIVCSTEIDFYRRKPGQEAISWIDISAPGFDPVAEGVDPVLVNRYFHVRLESGRLISGVDGFIEIWKRIPSIAWWASVSQFPGVRPLMKLGYSGFVLVRPLLPRRKAADCHNGACSR